MNEQDCFPHGLCFLKRAWTTTAKLETEQKKQQQQQKNKTKTTITSARRSMEVFFGDLFVIGHTRTTRGETILRITSNFKYLIIHFHRGFLGIIYHSVWGLL